MSDKLLNVHKGMMNSINKYIIFIIKKLWFIFEFVIVIQYTRIPVITHILNEISMI